MGKQPQEKNGGSDAADDVLQNTSKEEIEKLAAGDIEVNANLTVYVALACLVAASGGVLFGYDAGCTGGVETMKQFAEMWFPATASKTDTSFYCKFNDKTLQAYSAVMHFTGAVASLFAGYITQRFGRTTSMIVAGTSYIAGSILQAAASKSIGMLFAGRICWGIGVGFGDHCAFIYTAEMAPPQWRGRLNSMVQTGTFLGLVVASAINVGTNYLVWGWRLSLGLAAVPGAILLLGGIFLPNTPNSLVERGNPEKAKAVLRRVRGTKDVDTEFKSILVANKVMENMENPWRAIIRRKNIPQLTLAIMMPLLQQWSGVNAVSFFSPQIFAGVAAFSGGHAGNEGQLFAALLVNAVQLVSNIVCIIFVDKVGRRTLLISGSILGLLADYAVAIVFAVTYAGGAALPQTGSLAAIILICLYGVSFGFSWGPIGWLVPSEIHDLNTRSAGQSITVFTQLISGAIVTQVFLMMMCTMKYGVFIFFGAWQTIALIFVLFFLPETRGVPIERSAQHVRSHWFWRKVAYKNGVIPDEDKPPRDKKEIEMDGKHANAGSKNNRGRANGAANGNGKHQVHDPTENDHVSRSNAA
ncbi:g7471 [Coccomyxa viridis]|uniref:G7471 protein n=1 Tax=Coccomyxa viridis TaxID=1274662 RepID=A0ABP1FXX4_9CHLO